ncbi:S8 family peptidase [Catellatospora methionotrophica]|uniref:S8 family peptidase n=1 Tax=Catellatospora methionotrophica TaxID=121620 RepID=UPI003402C0B5
MSLPRRLGVTGTALALVIAAMGMAGVSPAQAHQAAAPSGGAGSSSTVITLVTGDRVLWSDGRVEFARGGAGREKMSFSQQKLHGETYVIPSDAVSLVAAGRVDRRLFNVSKLAEYGYEATPVIVTYDSATKVSSRREGRVLASINGEAFKIGKGDVGRFWSEIASARGLRSGASKIWFDAPVRASLDSSVGQIGAPAAWQAGHTGRGVTVAVLDTGIDAAHPDLADAVVGAQDFTGSINGVKDLVGHGTHVAGIITGNGSAFNGKYVGVAPDAKLLNGKVLGDSGEGPESAIIAGMEWAVAQGADVINMSLGSLQAGDGQAAMDLALNRLTEQSGALFVVAAGNSGPGASTVASPGAADQALTVGAVDRNENIADFSSRGPRFGDAGLKPDITGPGVGIVAALAEGSEIGRQQPTVDGKYVALNGTSMATPHVAGAAAILAGMHTDWDARQLKPALMNSAKSNDTLTAFEQGAGRVDVARAIGQAVISSPASINNGLAQWPHEDDQPINKNITYHNLGDAPMTLNLSIVASAPGAPAGMFTLDRDQVTVPTGGTATAMLVTNTAVQAQDRTYTGTVVATSGQTSVRTPFAVAREGESYEVAVTGINRAGAPADLYALRFVDINSPAAFFPFDPSGKLTVRLPKGSYYLDNQVFTPDPTAPGGHDVGLFVEPEIVVDRNKSLTFDSRKAKPVGVRVDAPDARPALVDMAFIRDLPSGLTGLIFLQQNFHGVRAAPSATTAKTGSFVYSIFTRMARPDGRGRFANSPYMYHIAAETQRRVPDNAVLRVRDRDLATVQSRFASADRGQLLSKDYTVDVVGPATITERYTPNMVWRPRVVVNFDPATFNADGMLSSRGVAYSAGETVVERWNTGVFGPSMTRGEAGNEDSTFRTGNFLRIITSLHADQPDNHQGVFVNGETSLTLKRNGEIITEIASDNGIAEVPQGTGPLQLTAKATRPNRLSTRVDATWTFTSPQGAQPLMAVRFAPDLDDRNRTKAGRAFLLPVSVEQIKSSAAGSLEDLRIQVSYDDGRSWRSVWLLGHGNDRKALLFHPRSSGFVSLKASAIDSKGNALEQTIIRAYELFR